jgi:hypothetical protein
MFVAANDESRAVSTAGRIKLEQHTLAVCSDVGQLTRLLINRFSSSHDARALQSIGQRPCQPDGPEHTVLEETAMVTVAGIDAS